MTRLTAPGFRGGRFVRSGVAPPPDAEPELEAAQAADSAHDGGAGGDGPGAATEASGGAPNGQDDAPGGDGATADPTAQEPSGDAPSGEDGASAEPTPPDLDSLTKQGLIDLAAERGIEIDPNGLKAEIRAAIDAAMEGGA